MDYFEKLGSVITSLWKQSNYDERHFPEMAKTALSRMPPTQHTSFQEVYSWVLASESLPYQADLQAEFGEPPLTVYLGRAFRIEVLFWTGATPAIHQHAFSGAFCVLHGSSIHLNWEFSQEERVSNHLSYGCVSLKEAEILEEGEVRLIHSGSRFIHTTFHLDVPTVSVVVRTINEPDRLPQYSYLPPTMCYDPKDDLALLKRKCQVLAMLVKAGYSEQHDEMLHQLFESCDTLAGFQYLYQASVLRDKASFEDLLRAAAVRHETLVSKVRPAMAYLRRQAEIAKIRDKITDLDLRFFLALLINVPDRNVLLDLLKQRFPQADSIARFAGFVKQLSDAKLLGEEFSDPWLLMLQCLLRGKNSKDQIDQTFAEKYGDAQARSQQTKIANLAATISNFWLFLPLIEYQSIAHPLIQAVLKGPEQMYEAR